jgi:PAS domain S-box-containing protein/excisionase family DNA binding protein
VVAGQWLTVQDVAGLLQVRIETVRRWVRSGELPVLELGGPRSVYRIRPDDLDRFVWQRYRSLNEPSSDSQDPERLESHGVNGQQPDSPRNHARPSWIAAEGFGAGNGDANTTEQARIFVDTVPAVTFREDASESGSVLYVSREIEALLGYPLSEWRDQPRFWLAHVHPADRAEVEAEFARTDATGDPFNMDYRLIAMDGRTVWIHCEAVLTPDANDGMPAWEGVLVDITERKKIEDALGLRERQQQAVARLGQRALAGVDLSTLLDEAVVYVSRSLDVEYTKIFEVLPGGDTLILRAGVGWLEGRVGEVNTPVGQVDATTVPSRVDSQSGYTLLSHEPVISEDLVQEDRFDGPRMAVEHGVKSGVSVILPGRGRPFGVLGAHSTRRRSFSQEDVVFLQSVANVVASVVARSDTNWLTVTDVADFLQVTEETVRRWIRRSELPALNLGGPRAGYRVYPSDLERFIGDRLIRM